jgi:hypothetical protein
MVNKGLRPPTCRAGTVNDLYRDQAAHKASIGGDQDVNERIFLCKGAFTFAQRRPIPGPLGTRINPLETMLNAFAGKTPPLLHECRLLATESADDTPYVVVNKGRFPSRRRFCPASFTFRTKG